MERTLKAVHHRIVALECTRRTLYRERCRQIGDLSIGREGHVLNDISDFAGAIAKIEGELYQLWQVKRLLLIDEKARLLKRQPKLRPWSWLSPMIDVPKPPPDATSSTATLGMNL